MPQADALRSAALLLDAGADPDAGYAWHGLTPPFTALTGVFGEGEQGPGRQPRHPRSIALARLLLEAGADPNDGQTLYNRMFRPDDDDLRLLFEHGLGREASGVWRDRLGGALETPAEMLARPLTWAAAHGFADRVRLLLRHGVDPEAVSPEGRAAPLAAAAGHREIVDLLVAAGAAPVELGPVEALVAGCWPGTRADPAALPAALAARPGLVAEAVEAGAAPELAVRLGFDVSGREDGRTALHAAAWNGDLAAVRRLVELGADLDARDSAFGTRPVDWAAHAHQPDVVAYLRAADRRRAVGARGRGGPGPGSPPAGTAPASRPPAPASGRRRARRGRSARPPPRPAASAARYAGGSLAGQRSGGRRGSTPSAAARTAGRPAGCRRPRPYGPRRRPSPGRRAR